LQAVDIKTHHGNLFFEFLDSELSPALMLVSLVKLFLDFFNLLFQLLKLLEVRHQLTEHGIAVDVFYKWYLVVDILKGR